MDKKYINTVASDGGGYQCCYCQQWNFHSRTIDGSPPRGQRMCANCGHQYIILSTGKVAKMGSEEAKKDLEKKS